MRTTNSHHLGHACGRKAGGGPVAALAPLRGAVLATRPSMATMPDMPNSALPGAEGPPSEAAKMIVFGVSFSTTKEGFREYWAQYGELAVCIYPEMVSGASFATERAIVTTGATYFMVSKHAVSLRNPPSNLPPQVSNRPAGNLAQLQHRVGDTSHLFFSSSTVFPTHWFLSLNQCKTMPHPYCARKFTSA